MNRKESVNLQLNKELEILVKGEYSEFADGEIFEVESIDLIKGDNYNLLDWANATMARIIARDQQKYTDIFVVLEELCLEKIKN